MPSDVKGLASEEDDFSASSRVHLTWAQYQWKAIDLLQSDLAQTHADLANARTAKEAMEAEMSRTQQALLAVHATICSAPVVPTSAPSEVESEASAQVSAGESSPAPFCGIGVIVQEESVKLDGKACRMVVIKGLKDGGPAARSGTISKNDIILEVDDEPVRGLGIARAKRLLMGPSNSEIRIKGRHASAPSAYEVTLIRAPGDGNDQERTERTTHIKKERREPEFDAADWSEYFKTDRVPKQSSRRHATELAQEICEAFHTLRASRKEIDGSIEAANIVASIPDQNAPLEERKEEMDRIWDEERRELVEVVRKCASKASFDLESLQNMLHACKTETTNLKQGLASCQNSQSDKSVLTPNHQMMEGLQKHLDHCSDLLSLCLSETAKMLEGWKEESKTLCWRILFHSHSPQSLQPLHKMDLHDKEQEAQEKLRKELEVTKKELHQTQTQMQACALAADNARKREIRVCNEALESRELLRAQVHTLEQQLRDMYSKVETQQQIQSDDMKRQAEKHLIDRKRENDEHERKLRDLKRKMEEENEMSTRKEDEWTHKQEQLEDSIGKVTCRLHALQAAQEDNLALRSQLEKQLEIERRERQREKFEWDKEKCSWDRERARLVQFANGVSLKDKQAENDKHEGEVQAPRFKDDVGDKDCLKRMINGRSPGGGDADAGNQVRKESCESVETELAKHTREQGLEVKSTGEIDLCHLSPRNAKTEQRHSLQPEARVFSTQSPRERVQKTGGVLEDKEVALAYYDYFNHAAFLLSPCAKAAGTNGSAGQNDEGIIDSNVNVRMEPSGKVAGLREETLAEGKEETKLLLASYGSPNAFKHVSRSSAKDSQVTRGMQRTTETNPPKVQMDSKGEMFMSWERDGESPHKSMSSPKSPSMWDSWVKHSVWGSTYVL